VILGFSTTIEANHTVSEINCVSNTVFFFQMEHVNIGALIGAALDNGN
jgi:hypothetical protein